MPKMGESIAEATIIRWLKNEGDRIEADEPVLEIATDKVDSEVPAQQGGILSAKLFKENDVVKVGQAVALIETEAATTSSQSKNIRSHTIETPVSNSIETALKIVETAKETAAPMHANGNRFYSPLVLNIAKEEGVSMPELESMPGTGSEGRVTKRDILLFVENKKSGVTSTEPALQSTPEEKVSTPDSQPTKPPVSINAGDEIIEMDRMRRLIADHMTLSKATSAHVTSFVEADVTNLVLWREKMKKVFEIKENEKLTFTPLFIEALVKAIKDLPMVNVSVDGFNLIKRKNINIGMATALPSGNLIVPVIRNADTKNLIGLTREVNDLAKRARENKLSPDEISGGTYTLTNVGTFGNVMGTPIINQPQVAIMATGAIRKKPAVMETEYGDVIAIRHMMFLSHSYDHRVVDGALGGSFVRRFADYLENWDINREI